MSIIVGHVILFGAMIPVKLIQRYLLRPRIHSDEQKGQLNIGTNIFLGGVVLHY